MDNTAQPKGDILRFAPDGTVAIPGEYAQRMHTDRAIGHSITVRAHRNAAEPVAEPTNGPFRVWVTFAEPVERLAPTRKDARSSLVGRATMSRAEGGPKRSFQTALAFAQRTREVRISGVPDRENPRHDARGGDCRFGVVVKWEVRDRTGKVVAASTDTAATDDAWTPPPAKPVGTRVHTIHERDLPAHLRLKPNGTSVVARRG